MAGMATTMESFIMRTLLAALTLLVAAPFAHAGDADFDINCGGTPDTCRAAFAEVTKDITAALHYKQLAPLEATGITGVGVGAIGSYIPVDKKSAWNELTGTKVDAIGMVGVVANKGLPLGIDVAAFYTAIPGTGASAYGAQVRYALLEGGVATPGIAVSANYTTTSGIDDFDYDAYGIDAGISKGFAFLTPYAGVGYVWAKATPGSSVKAATGVENEKVDEARFFVGLRMSLAFFEVTPEYERFGDRNVYNLRLGFSF